jgi:hypothetical protein
MQLNFWFDPACPWTWNTSRWATEVADRRSDVTITWRTFSLEAKNADVDLPDEIRHRVERSHRYLRVVEAARAAGHADRIGALYTELGRRIHHEDQIDLDIAAVLAAVGLPPGLAASADDPSLDTVIDESMREALDLAGDDVGVPIIGVPVGGGQTGFFGPIVLEAPTGVEALELFDLVLAAAAMPTFTELKRARNGDPVLPSAPAAAAAST